VHGKPSPGTLKFFARVNKREWVGKEKLYQHHPNSGANV
jgi:hypothetical protein